MKNTPTEDLFERLQSLTGVEYISGLKRVDYERIRALLPELEAQKYTLFQWLDAAQYFTNTTPKLETVQEVYEYMLHFQK